MKTLSPRWEQFCIALVAGETQTAAYRAAGFKGGASGACSLARKAPIRARVAELIAEKMRDPARALAPHVDLDAIEAVEMARTTGTVSRDWILSELLCNARLAREVGQLGAASKALELIARIAGHYVPGTRGRKAKFGGAGDVERSRPAPPMLSPEKLNALLDALSLPGEA